MTATEVSAALEALRQFPVLSGRVTETHVRAALEAAERERNLIFERLFGRDYLSDRSDT